MSPAMLTSKEGINKNMISLFYLCVLVCTNDKQMLPVCIPIRQHLEACTFFLWPQIPTYNGTNCTK